MPHYSFVTRPYVDNDIVIHAIRKQFVCALQCRDITGFGEHRYRDHSGAKMMYFHGSCDALNAWPDSINAEITIIDTLFDTYTNF